MTTIHLVLEEFRQAATSNRDLGDKFERLIATYLVTDPLYQDKFSDVWLWGEWPDRGNQPDVGIDLVAKERYSGGFCAIQCKFYDPSHTLQKSDIDSFFTASGKALFTSRMIVCTTDKWSRHAEDALENQHTPVTRLRVQDLADSPVDWSKFSLKTPDLIKLKARNNPREHQKLALQKVQNGFQENDRGKLIMACGTGKTFTSLKIAETLVPRHGTVLFLVPSISLLSQTLREWTAQTAVSMSTFAVCSDSKVGKKNENEDISAHDLAFPATTDARKLANQVTAFAGKRDLAVIFSTYQSIEVVAAAQANGLPEFDLIICDEAHRTTGVTLGEEQESHFVKVHDQDFIKGAKRLYMTATPKIFSDSAQAVAQENGAAIVSMDKEAYFGPEFHRLGFGEAVGAGLLADYKVMVLAVDEKYVSKAFQSQIADENSEISLDDAVKITGCWNGLSKRMLKGEDGANLHPEPMRRAVAFSRSIKDSKRLKSMFSQIVDEYRATHESDDDLLACEVDHVDGTFNSLKRNSLLDWLKADTTAEGNVCRILSNARCLSEGVDVPALDAVMFLNPRNSVVDVVQSVGRVMRTAKGKKYGYVILPIGIPSDLTPEEALKDNQKYKVVWQVLQALRAHDDRFNATINHIELNKRRPDQIEIIGIGGGDGDDVGDGNANFKEAPFQASFNFPHIEEWRDAIYAKIVQKCGDRGYWENWAGDVAVIAARHVERITALVSGSNHGHRAKFNKFLKELRDSLNPSITEGDAIEMLAQHIITRPVFDAVFEGYQFTQNNPVSVSMQKMLELLDTQALGKETIGLEKFYASVRERAAGIDNAAGKQHIIKELYDKFFNTAFRRMADRLGIVYTPVEIVDFIIRSVDHASQKEFGVGISNPGVHVIDPFTGTGTFIVRLLQSGIIKDKDFLRKYKNELHANEIVLLAYYIAAINIEEAFHGIYGGDYKPFEGIVLTDTFQMTEGKRVIEGLEDRMLPENTDRAVKQKNADIRIIIGNPPYSGSQDSVNDGNPGLKYEVLDESIRNTYAAFSTATNKTSLYNSYIRAFRWASDRVKETGIVCYVSNGYFIDSKAADGLRHSLGKEFSSIYCFNLRGDQTNTSGEKSRQEGGKIFGSLSRSSIAITLLVKNPKHVGACKLFYHDIGDYLTREKKLEIIAKFGSVENIPWDRIEPNSNNDWINQRDPAFDEFLPMGDRKNLDKSSAIFSVYSNGVQSNRESWVWNFGKDTLSSSMIRMIDFYNSQVDGYAKAKAKNIDVDDFINTDPTKIGWTRSLKGNLAKLVKGSFKPEFVVQGMYRPFAKQYLYIDRFFNEYVNKMPSVFPFPGSGNMLICVASTGSNKKFSALITDVVPDVEMISKGQCFPLYIYDKEDVNDPQLFETSTENGYVKRDAITDEALSLFRAHYENSITKEDIFFYVYGILHSEEYRSRFASDLKKVLPRMPLAANFWDFSSAGRELAALHLNYETVEEYPLEESTAELGLSPKEDNKVNKMFFPKKGKELDKTRIVVNANLSLGAIPIEAYQYVVNGKPPLELAIDNYRLEHHKVTHIPNNPNQWSDDPRYIINLLKKLVTISLRTTEIVKALPSIDEFTLKKQVNFESSRIIAAASKQASSQFFTDVPEWIQAQVRSRVLRLDMNLITSGDGDFIELMARAAPSPFLIKQELLTTSLSPKCTYAAVARFPSGTMRTIGEVTVDTTGMLMFEPFGYWSLLDPEQDITDENIPNALAVQCDIVVMEVM